MKLNNLSMHSGDVLSNKSRVNETFRDIHDLDQHEASQEEQDIFSEEDEWGLPIDQIDT